jgi:hypothetical protein
MVVEVRLVRVVPGAADDSVLGGRLAATDWTAIRSLGFAADRDRAATARAALRHELGRRLRLDPRLVPLSTPDGGRPRVTGTNLEVSWSHSGTWVVFAVAPGRPVGVDIEQVPVPVPARALARVGVGSIAEFVAREAAGKVTGEGLGGIPPDDIAIHPFAAPAGYVGAVAAPGTDWRASLRIAADQNPPARLSAAAVGAWDNFGSPYQRPSIRTGSSRRV